MARWPRLKIVILALVAAAAAGADELPDDAALRQQVLSELHALFGREFQVDLSPHFIVFHDTDELFARGRAALLERAHREFFETFGRRGFEPQPLTRRLVCLLFTEFDDFVRYAAAADGQEIDFIGGYYSLRTNRIAFHDERTHPQLDEVTRKLDDLQTELAQLRRKIAESRRSGAADAEDRRRVDELLRHQRWLSNRMGIIAAGSNDAKTTHEAAHQLAFNTGIQSPKVRYPLWVVEGLATNFELQPSATAPGQFGLSPYHDNIGRRSLLTEAYLHRRLVSLDEFLVVPQVPQEADHKAAAELYAHAWGLFRFLFTRHPGALREYLADLAAGPPAERSKEDLLRQFEAAFGPIPRIQRDFNRYLRSLH